MPDDEQCIQSAHRSASSTAAGERRYTTSQSTRLQVITEKTKMPKAFVESVTRYFQTTASYLLRFFSSFPYKTRLSVR